MNKSRLEMLSDGVFAIVITLLVLDIKLPANLHIDSDRALRQQLAEILPNIAAYILSFCIIGIFWNAHHTIFSLIRVINKKVLWLNIFYLMVVAFIPFPTAILAEHSDKQTAVILYSFTLGFAGLFHFIILSYTYHNRKLASPGFTKALRKKMLFPSLFGPASYFISMAVSVFSLYTSLAILLVVPVYYIFFNNPTGE